MEIQSSLDPDGPFGTRLGAEARIELIDWQGELVIRKTRFPKSYRNPELDKLLRTRRTREEVEILYHAKLAGVSSPVVYFADPESGEIYMEYIRGALLKDIETEDSGRRNISKDLAKYYERVGALSSILHMDGIIHGDLTTKNVIVSDPGTVYLIDFGLSFISERIEDKAEDLHILKQSLRSSTSAKRANRAFSLVATSYRKGMGTENCDKILKQISEIERRGRYAQVD